MNNNSDSHGETGKVLGTIVGVFAGIFISFALFYKTGTDYAFVVVLFWIGGGIIGSFIGKKYEQSIRELCKGRKEVIGTNEVKIDHKSVHYPSSAKREQGYEIMYVSQKDIGTLLGLIHECMRNKGKEFYYAGRHPYAYNRDELYYAKKSFLGYEWVKYRNDDDITQHLPDHYKYIISIPGIILEKKDIVISDETVSTVAQAGKIARKKWKTEWNVLVTGEYSRQIINDMSDNRIIVLASDDQISSAKVFKGLVEQKHGDLLESLFEKGIIKYRYVSVDGFYELNLDGEKRNFCYFSDFGMKSLQNDEQVLGLVLAICTNYQSIIPEDESWLIYINTYSDVYIEKNKIPQIETEDGLKEW